MIDLPKIDFQSSINNSINNLKGTPDFDSISIQIHIDQKNIFYSHQEIIDLMFLNIIDNAIKYRKWNVTDSKLTISITSDEEKAFVTFADNGVGITSKNEQNVFDMFYREGRKEGAIGTGLGLYIVKVSLQKINGLIKYYTNTDEGATFVVEIPNMHNP